MLVINKKQYVRGAQLQRTGRSRCGRLSMAAPSEGRRREMKEGRIRNNHPPTQFLLQETHRLYSIRVDSILHESSAQSSII